MFDRLNSVIVGTYLRAQNGLRREEGQAVAEYALILALIAVVAAVALTTLGSNITSKLGKIATSIGP
jgi:pilus assembly protein Flp/PilA